jgi:hypothetical protein
MQFPPENGLIEKVIVPSESTPQQLPNEWSYQLVSPVNLAHFGA